MPIEAIPYYPEWLCFFLILLISRWPFLSDYLNGFMSISEHQIQLQSTSIVIKFLIHTAYLCCPHELPLR